MELEASFHYTLYRECKQTGIWCTYTQILFKICLSQILTILFIVFTYVCAIHGKPKDIDGCIKRENFVRHTHGMVQYIRAHTIILSSLFRAHSYVTILTGKSLCKYLRSEGFKSKIMRMIGISKRASRAIKVY